MEQVAAVSLTRDQMGVDMPHCAGSLTRMRLRPRIKTIFILTKIFDPQLILMTRDLSRWLLSRERDQEYIIYVEDKLRKHRLFDVEGLVTELCTEYAETERVEAEAAAPPSRQGILAITTAEAAARRKDSLASRLGAWNAEACRGSTSSGVNGDGGAANVDFIITLGGDGTVLYASWLFQQEVPPVVSFALGSLGFLTKFDFGDFQSVLTTAFDAGVTVSCRRRFQGIIMRSEKKRRLPGVTEEEAAEAEEACRDLVDELIGEAREAEITHCEERRYEILNEIVVDRGPNPTLSYMEVFGDDEHFTTVLADGICVSTPTGSTAYNLAAGGSLCHPENPVMLVTSICAHTLSSRPIILPDTIVLRIGVPYDARHSSWVSFDGRERVELNPGDYVTIRASRYPFPSVQTEGRRSEDWVNSISGKLGWNTRHRQKEYNEWVVR